MTRARRHGLPRGAGSGRRAADGGPAAVDRLMRRLRWVFMLPAAVQSGRRAGHGCDLAQGFHVGRPMTAETLLAWARKRGDVRPGLLAG